MFFYLILIFTSDQNQNLINKLGHTDYYIREAITEELVEQGKEIFPLLDKIKEQTEDLEVKWRCEEVKNRYYSVIPHDLSIWMLPMEYRFITDGEETIDMSIKYFNECQHDNLEEKTQLALTKYFTEQLNEDKVSRKELLKLRLRIINLTKQLYSKYEVPNMRPDLFYTTEPIETRLMPKIKLTELDDKNTK